MEQRPSPWGLVVTIIAKPNYRSTISNNFVRKSWPMPDMNAHIDTAVAGAKFITICEVQNAHYQITVAEI